MTDIDVEVEQRVRERTAQIEAVNREFAAFVAAVARDLRTPLLAIQGVAAVFRQPPAGGLVIDARECIDFIQMNVERMSGMLDSLTRISLGSDPGAVIHSGKHFAAADGTRLDAALRNLGGRPGGPSEIRPQREAG